MIKEESKSLTKEEFKALRQRLGMTQKEFAHKLGFTERVRVTSIESGNEGLSNQVEAHCLTLLDHLKRAPAGVNEKPR